MGRAPRRRRRLRPSYFSASITAGRRPQGGGRLGAAAGKGRVRLGTQSQAWRRVPWLACGPLTRVRPQPETGAVQPPDSAEWGGGVRMKRRPGKGVQAGRKRACPRRSAPVAWRTSYLSRSLALVRNGVSRRGAPQGGMFEGEGTCAPAAARRRTSYGPVCSLGAGARRPRSRLPRLLAAAPRARAAAGSRRWRQPRPRCCCPAVPTWRGRAAHP
jgi:hypothetical protein